MDKKLLIDYFNRCAKDRRKRRRRNHYYYEQLESYFEFIIPQGSSVLEIGCGTGETLNALKPARGLGIDFCPEMVRLARNEFPHLEFRVEDIEELKTTEKFDYVILSDLVGLLLDVQTAFNQLKKVCSARTRVIIVNYNYLWEPVLKLAEKIGLRTPQLLQNWLSLPDIENLLYLSNFEVIKKGCRVLLPIYIPIVSTLFNKFISKLPLLSRLSLVQIIIARPKPFSVVEDNYSCSVVIACRNELGNIRPTIERIPKIGSHTEIIFVEGHSKDGTLSEINEQIKNFPEKDIKVLVQGGIGKGDAVHKGFSHAKGDILMVLDADLTVYPEELQKFYDTLASGKAEFAMGSRLVYPIEEGAMRFLNLVGNKFFSIVFSYLLEQRIKDTLCANKAFFRRDYKTIEMVRDLLGNFDPFGDFDLIFGAARYNLKILEIPVRYNPRTYGTTQISRFSHGWLLLKMCWIAFWRLKIK